MWLCPQCNEEHGDYNAYCEYCFYDSNGMVRVYNPSLYYVRDIRLYHLSKGDKPVTPQEELFAQFFKKHTDILLVKDMTLLQMQEYAEKYSKAALEGKAAVYAANQLIDGKKKSAKKEAGFSRDTNQTQTDAINVIKQKKLSKKELVEKQLKELYGAVETMTGQKVGEGAAKEAAKNVSAEIIQTVVEGKSRFAFRKKPTAADDAIQAILNPSNAKMLVDGKVTQPSAPIAENKKSFSSWRKDKQ